MSVRDRIAERLRTLAPIPAERIWGRARNIPVPDSKFDELDKRMMTFDPDSLGPEGNVWAGSPEDVAEALEEAGLLASEEKAVGYVVVHEIEIGGRTSHNTAGSIWPTIEPVENHLAYCRGMQEQDRPGSEGRYFIAKVIEGADDMGEEVSE